MNPSAAFGAAGLALLLFARVSRAEDVLPVQLRWQAPANCPQAAQVRQKLRELLGGSAAETAQSRLRAEGQIEPIGERFRLTLNIHYDLVNGARVVYANSCEDLSGVAAVTLALLFRAEHSSSAPLTALDLGGATTAVGAESRSIGTEQNQSSGAESSVSDADKPAADAEHPPPTPKAAAEKPEADEQTRSSELHASEPSHWRFVLRAPELRVDMGVLPNPSYGMGLGAGLRHDAWRFLLSGALWLAQDYEPGPFVGYGAHFGRVSGELTVCRGWQFGEFELAPCVLLSLDDVAARGTGVGISSTNPRTAWLSMGAGVQGLWSLGRSAALVFGVNGRIASSRPHFVSDSVGEIAQVGPVALGVVLGCEWRF